MKRHNGEPIQGLCVLKGGYRFFTDLVPSAFSQKMMHHKMMLLSNF
jgi:hypothetical protein